MSYLAKFRLTLGEFINKHQKLLLVVALYSLITIVFSWPIILRITEVIWGYSGDNFGSFWVDWWGKFSQSRNLAPNFTNYVNYPFGTGIVNVFNIELGWALASRFLAVFFGAIAAFNIVVLVSFPLSGLAMYLLAFHITRHQMAAFVTGLIYMLLPYHFWQSYQHIALAQTQWLPLYLFTLLRFEEKMTLGRSVLLAASFVLVASSSIYHGYFMVLFTLCYITLRFIYGVLVNRKNYLNPQRLGKFVLTGLIVLLLMSPVFLVIYLQTQANKNANFIGSVTASSRPINDLLSLSTRPWDFIIPPRNHPVFGRFEKPIYQTIREMSNDFKTISAYLPERIVYIGIPSLLLAALGLITLLRQKEKRELGVVLFLAAVILFLVASPPFIIVKNQTIYFPSQLLYNFIPFIRVYARLGIVIDLLVLTLTASGLAYLFNQIKSQKKKKIVLVLLTLFFIFELMNFPPYHFTDLSKTPQTYKWLATQPDNVRIIEYPKTYNVMDSMFFQTKHQKALLNLTEDFNEDKYTPIISLIENPVASHTASILAALGINYGLVHTADPYLRSNPFDETGVSQVAEEGVVTPLLGNGTDGFKRGEVFDDGFFVAVVAEPAKLVLFDKGSNKIYPPEGWQWKKLVNRLYLINLDQKPKKVKVTIPTDPQIRSISTNEGKINNNEITIEIGINQDNRVKWVEFIKIDGVEEINLAGVTIEEII